MKAHRVRITIILSLILTLIAFPMITVQAQTEETPLVEYTVTAQTANVRSGPGTSFSIVGTVSAGDALRVYDEEPEENGWLRFTWDDETDAYIADFLVEKAPLRYYPVSQDPIIEVSGSGRGVSDIFEIPRGAYRIDAEVSDNFFILKSIVIEGECRDSTIFNEGVFESNSLSVSTLFVSQGCSIIFETDNVDRAWRFEIRDILNEDFLPEATLPVESNTTIFGVGTQATMPTLITEGIWTITASVDDNFFILRAEPLGDCDSGSVFNEGDMDASSLEVEAVYRAEEDCIVFWQTSNVDSEWEITFNKLR